MNSTPNRIAIVSVTYNSGGVIQGLVDAVAKHEPGSSVVVVDNASPGGPPSVNVSLVRMEGNAGFGAGCNAARAVLSEGNPPEYVAFLNPDVRLQANSLTQIADQMDSEPTTGLATGTLVGPDGTPMAGAWGPPSAARLLWKLFGLDLPRVRRYVGRFGKGGVLTSASSMVGSVADVEGFVIGGAMMARWSCLEALNWFDERFFLTWEDTDLCTRGRQAGWRTSQYVTDPIVHFGSHSSEGVSARQWRRWYWEGARIYADKHRDSMSTLSRVIVRIGARGMSRMR
jgi:GT2 family glycosyltransferase